MATTPTVHLYASCWNEERMLPFFFDHYDRFVDSYTIFDNGSTDGSRSLLDDHPKVRWEHFDVPGDSLVAYLTDLNDNCWKASRGKADWVIACNIDELIWHPDTPDLLNWAKELKYTVLPTDGYEMVSATFPSHGQHLVDSLRWGMAWPNLCKPSIFSPDAIDEINFAAGRHSAAPTGEVSSPPQPVWQLRHFKYLGLNYALTRWKELGPRLFEGDRRTGAGAHWLANDVALARRYLNRAVRSRRVPEPPAVSRPAETMNDR